MGPRPMLQKLRKRDDAVLSMGPILGVVGVVLGIVVLFLVMANLFPTFADAVADVNENLTDPDVTFGDATADGIKPVFAIVLGLAAIIGIVGLLLKGFDKLD